MALYERLLGRKEDGSALDHDAGDPSRISVHLFSSLMGEVARGKFASNAAARDELNASIRDPLSASEGTEAITLLGTITGTATAKLARAKEIDDVLILGEQSSPSYNLPSKVKTRLGV